jgi:hypothetical protein
MSTKSPIRQFRLASSAWVEGNSEGVGLINDWAYRIIKAVGRYGEIFERRRPGLAEQDRPWL